LLPLGSLQESFLILKPICFADFKKAFDMVLRKNLWNKLEEIKVSFKLRVAAITLHENAIAKFKNTQGWLDVMSPST